MKEDYSHFYFIRDAYLTDSEEAKKLVAANPGLLDARNSLGETVLHWLAVENEISGVKSLLASGAAVNTVNSFGVTPLTEAATLGHLEMCKLLIDHGANVRHVSGDGYTALSCTASNRHLQILELLLSCFPPEEPLTPYFEDLELFTIYETEDEVSRLLESRGLESN